MTDRIMFHKPGLTEQMIADALRSNPSPKFCQNLAMLLDPGRKKPMYRLKLSRRGRGAPKKDDGGRKLMVGQYIGQLRDRGATYEEALHEAEEKFGVKSTYANEAWELEQLARMLGSRN